MDDRLSRERSHILMRTVNALRQEFSVEVLEGELSEAQVLAKLQENPAHLLLAPWYRYLAWTRIDAFLAQGRGQGPLFAGYVGEPATAEEMGERSERARLVLIDFAQLGLSEILGFVGRMADEKLRSGLRPMFVEGTLIHTDNWRISGGLGLKLDSVMGLPEIAHSPDWSKRATEIRITMMALWNLVFDEGGPGRAAGTGPKACFQLGADDGCLAFRLCTAMPSWGPKETVAAFWPSSSNQGAAATLLQSHADFLRVHLVGEGPEIEIVVGFLASGGVPGPLAGAHRLRTLWVDPIAPRLVSEIPFQAPGPQAPYLRALEASSAAAASSRTDTGGQHEETAKLKRFMVDAASRIRDLKRELNEKDQVIQELRSGGVGTAQPLPPPDVEALLDAFQNRIEEAQSQIHQLEGRIAHAEKNGADPQLLRSIRTRATQLMKREQGWIRRLQETISAGKKSGKR